METMLQIQRDRIFVCLIGAPGSGKSTFVKSHLKGYTIISSDDIITALAATVGKTYNEGFQEFVGQAEQFCLVLFEHALLMGSHVAIDQTNVTKEKRAKWLQRVPMGYHKIAVHFGIDFDTVKERLESRERATGKHIPLEVVESMIAKLEPPTIEEGFNEVLLV